VPLDNGAALQGAERHEEMRSTLCRHSRASPAKPGALPSSQTGLQIQYGQQGAQPGLSDTVSVAHRSMAHVSMDGAGANPGPNPNGMLLRMSKQQAFAGGLASAVSA